MLQLPSGLMMVIVIASVLLIVALGALVHHLYREWRAGRINSDYDYTRSGDWTTSDS